MQDWESMITENIERKLAIEKPFSAPSRTQIGKNHLGEERSIQYHLPLYTNTFNNYYKSVLGWIPANPSKQDIADAIKHAYVFSSKNSNTIPNNLVNYIEGHINFYSQLLFGDEDTFFLVGPRGSGKTFYLNFLVNTKTKEFYDNGYIWFRAELSKLYRHNISYDNRVSFDSMNTSRKYSLEEYFSVHIVYVSFKYRHENPILRKIWEGDKKFLDLLIDLWYKDVRYNSIIDEPDKLIEQFKELIEKLEIDERKTYDRFDFTKNHVEKILWNPNQVIESHLITNAILSFLRRNSFVPIFIIDGLDNIDYYENAEHYSDIIAQVRDFCLRDEKKNYYGGKAIVSVRDETFDHLKNLAFNYFKAGQHPVFRVSLNNPVEVLKKKIEIMLNPKCNYFKLKRDQSQMKVDNYLQVIYEEQVKSQYKKGAEEFFRETTNDFYQFSEFVFTNFCKAINETLNAEDHDEEEINELYIFNNIYNQNMRAFIHNFLGIYNYIILFKNKMKHMHNPDKRTYLLTEGQLLNGSLYLDSKSVRKELGRCIPNIFYFSSNTSSSNWHGLCALRLLQLLRDRNTKKRAKKSIKEDFGYDEECINERFQYCLTNGLILSDSKNDERERLFKTSPKGEFIIKYILYDINNFYYLALDTPVPEELIENSKLIRIHHNNREIYWENYIESCILTSITFIRLLLTQHSHEIQKLSISDREKYSFPTLFPNILISKMCSKLSLLQNFKNQQRYESLINDIQGIN